jgi:hypothetical protein
MPRCKATTKNGDQCRNNSISGTSFCYISYHGQIQKTFLQKARNFFRNHWQALVAAISLPLTAISLFSVYWYLQDKKLNATSGAISSAAESAAMSISVGSAEFHMLSKDGVVFDEGGDPLLSIRLLNGRLLVTTRVRDTSGGIIAEMNDNEWKHQRQPAIFDRNYTQDVLEIRDNTGKVVLQVANLGNTVDVAAIFHCKNGWTYMAGPIAGEGSAIELRPHGEALRSEIPPICDYPSDLHFGSCPGIERLKKMALGPHTTYTLHFPVHLCL